MSDVLEELLAELLAEVRAARREDAAHKRRTDRIKELLVQVRMQRKKISVADIEEQIGRYYDRATISRVTVPEMRRRRAAG